MNGVGDPPPPEGRGDGAPKGLEVRPFAEVVSFPVFVFLVESITTGHVVLFLGAYAN